MNKPPKRIATKNIAFFPAPAGLACGTAEGGIAIGRICGMAGGGAIA
jgi:hypothetical protein